MERLYISSYDALADIMYKKALQNETTYAVLFYDEAIELLRHLMKYQEIDINSLDAATGEYNGYYKEYVVSLSYEMQLDIEPAWHEANKYAPAGYLWIGSADVIFIDGDAKSSILKGVEANTYEIIVGEEVIDSL